MEHSQLYFMELVESWCWKQTGLIGERNIICHSFSWILVNQKILSWVQHKRSSSKKIYFSYQGWFNTRKSMTVIHIRRVNERKESSEHLRRDAEHIHEISNHSWLKSKLRTKGNLLNLIMDIYSKTATDIVLSSKMLKVFTLKLGCHLEYFYF